MYRAHLCERSCTFQPMRRLPQYILSRVCAHFHKELQQIRAACDRHGLYFFMDDARFANAVDALGVSPKELTWKVGVDVLCSGGTKNGVRLPEAVVFSTKTWQKSLITAPSGWDSAHRRCVFCHLPGWAFSNRERGLNMHDTRIRWHAPFPGQSLLTGMQS